MHKQTQKVLVCLHWRVRELFLRKLKTLEEAEAITQELRQETAKSREEMDTERSARQQKEDELAEIHR
jgi:hypothetical protein